MRPKIGLSVILLNPSYEILMQKRANSHGNGTWSFPGGHIEWNETLVQCGKREIREETGIKSSLVFIDQEAVAVTNDRFYKENRHYFTLYLRAHYFGEEPPQITEPGYCTDMGWFSWDKIVSMRRSLFLPLQHLISQNYNPVSGLRLNDYRKNRR